MSLFTSVIVTLGSIIFVDLILSGDNALVIGAVAAGMPRAQRRLALLLGGAGAIALRILFTAFATFILAFSFLQAIGGVVLLFIAVQLVREQDAGDENKEELALEEREQLIEAKKDAQEVLMVSRSDSTPIVADRISPGSKRLLMAIATIVIADVSTSLDNIVAIAALAHGQFLLLGIGLLISVVILLIGSALIAELIKKIPAIIILAGLILAWVSADLIINYVKTLPNLATVNPAYYNIPIYILALCIVAGFAAYARRPRGKIATQTQTLKIPEKTEFMRKG